MNTTSTSDFLVQTISRLIHGVLGISYQLKGLAMDDADLAFDLGYGRDE
ncbi:MAG: hypothetical protein V2I67_05705 [Thermoanaerobaculales bacterium]|jgi:hypothetical protein|nr:hypothetical protein [Thermoanaerobaculales bacterium]